MTEFKFLGELELILLGIFICEYFSIALYSPAIFMSSNIIDYAGAVEQLFYNPDFLINWLVSV